MVDDGMDVQAIRAAAAALHGRVRRTPTWSLDAGRLGSRLGCTASVALKLELFQHTGSFKPRGAFMALDRLSAEELERGVVTFSAGNHAMALAYCARYAGTSARVMMPRTASPLRVKAARELGAVVTLWPDVHDALRETRRVVEEEGRTFVHPFEGPATALGTATVGLELVEDSPALDAVVVPVGGGGLCAGVAAAVKLLQPGCAVFGVEPEGADSMHRSFAAGEPRSIDQVRTIADSLGAPHAAPYSFGLCRRFVDDLVRVTDDEICAAMAVMFADAKLAVEPAGASAAAALLGPLRARCAGARVGLIVCGANIDPTTYGELLARGAAAVG